MKRKAKQVYYISDWAGNDKTDYYGEFKSAEDAWEALYDRFKDLKDDEFDEQIGEFYVELREQCHE